MPIMRWRAWWAALLLFASIAGLALAAPRPYHCRLESDRDAPFGKFGRLAIDVYPKGIRMRTLWLNGFSLSGSRTITVENPLLHIYSDVAISDLARMVARVSGEPGEGRLITPAIQAPVAGTVRRIKARR